MKNSASGSPGPLPQPPDSQSSGNAQHPPVNRFQAVWLKGIPASPGLFKGPLYLLERPEVVVPVDPIASENVDEEVERLREVLRVLTARLEDIAAKQEHPAAQDLAQVQLEILHDPDLRETIRKFVHEDHLPGDQAVIKAFNQTIRALQARNIAWATERAVDIANLRDQCIQLYRQSEQPAVIPKGSVVFAEELSMGEVLQYGRGHLSALLLRKGGLTSHAIIVAQALGIPAVAGFGFSGNAFQNGQLIWVDGTTGDVVLNPDADTDLQMADRLDQQLQIETQNERQASRPSQTACGTSFILRANIEVEAELERLQKSKAQGVGLLRTETMLMDPKLRHPQQQLAFYRAVLKASAPHGATIRLFDAGGDKIIPGSPAELNPFLGWRGVRLLLDERHLLHNQMEALLRLSAEFPGQVRLLVPMVSEPSELRRIQHIRQEISEKLQQEGIITDPALQIGAMIEVPSAALMTESMAQYVDFYSIGTNDLIQYTLAADRGNAQVAHLFDSHHPAVWQLIHLAVRGAHNAGKPISVCGEMASHPVFAAAFLGLGIRELSMPPSMIANVKSMLIHGSMADFKTLAESILQCPDVEQVRSVVTRLTEEHAVQAAIQAGAQAVTQDADQAAAQHTAG